MREIQASQITDVIERLCIEANTVLPEDMKQAIPVSYTHLDVYKRQTITTVGSYFFQNFSKCIFMLF